MRAVNLLPRDQAHTTIRKESLPVLVGACSGVLVVAALGAMFMIGSGKVAAQQRKLDDLNRIYQALPPPPVGPSAAQQQLAGEQSARVSALSTALTSRVAWDRVFREFSLVLPDDVWLSTVSAKAPVSSSVATPPTAPAAGAAVAATGITMDGYTYSQPAVARLLTSGEKTATLLLNTKTDAEAAARVAQGAMLRSYRFD